MEKKLNCKTGHRGGGWLQAATLAAGVAFASTAHAQDAGTQGTQSGGVSVINPTRTVALRTTSPSTKQHWISYQDCVDDVELTFRVAVAAPSPNANLYAYVGISTSTASTTEQDGCLYNKARNDTTLCKPLTVKARITASPIVVIKATDLLSLFGIKSCDAAPPSASMSAIRLQFYFLLEPGAKEPGSINDYAIYEGTGIDLWGPEPPTSLVVTPGDEEIQLSFTPGSDVSSDRIGYRFFMDDGTGVAPVTTSGGGAGGATAGAGGSSGVTSGGGGSTSTSAGATTSSASTSTGAGGASTSTGVGGAGGMSTASATSSAATGAGGTGGAGGAATTGGMNLSTGVTGAGSIDACGATAVASTCTAASFLLVAGKAPTGGETGDALTTGTVGTITDLENGKAVVVAVAAYDDVGNLGALSELQCGTPTPVLSILRAYECSDSLKGGCGFCSVGGNQGVSTTALVSAGLFVFGFAARRSRRPRVASAPRGDR